MKMSKIDESIQNLQKAHNNAFIVMNLNDKKIVARERIPTGSFGLDRILGGGFVRGSLNEIIGPQSSGKTTICIHTMAQAQKLGKVLFIDLEHSFDPIYAESLGVSINNLLISQPEFAEQAFDVIEHLVATGEISLVVVDSIPALLPRSELEGDPGDSHMGLAARLNRQHLRRITHSASKTKTIILYVNQITYKISGYGNPETTGGGTGFGYFCSSICDIRSISTQKDNMAKQSIKARVRTVKNKTYIPFQETEFDIKFGKGIDYYGEVFDEAVKKKIIDKSGSWYSYKKDKLGQGRDNAIEIFKDDTYFKEVYKQISDG